VQDDASQLGFTDWYFGTALGPLGSIRYGKVKEPWSYEVVGDAANLQQMERILGPFFVTRNIGLRLTNTMASACPGRSAGSTTGGSRIRRSTTAGTSIRHG
jgi:hypothetical protein